MELLGCGMYLGATDDPSYGDCGLGAAEERLGIC